MHLTKVEDIVINDAKLIITCDFTSKERIANLKYTCPKCSGWNCNKHGNNNANCNGGMIYQEIKFDNLQKVFSDDQVQEIKKWIETIHLQIISGIKK